MRWFRTYIAIVFGISWCGVGKGICNSQSTRSIEAHFDVARLECFLYLLLFFRLRFILHFEVMSVLIVVRKQMNKVS